MGLFGKSNSDNNIIQNNFSYGKIIDPRTDSLKIDRIVSSRNDASKEFLGKYLHFVRTKHSKSRALEFLQSCSSMLENYSSNVPDIQNRDEYLQFMTHGFTMAAVEANYFKISQPNKMSSCALGAMADFYNSMLWNSKTNPIDINLAFHAMLSGYHLSRTALKTNTGR